jgi:hypothetical protein
VKDYHHQIVFSIDGGIKLTRGNEKPRPDGAGAKFVVSEAPKLPHPAYSGRCSAGVNERAAGDFHPMLENSRKPCGKCVESRWIEQEIRHHDKWHEDQQSIDPIPNGWRHFPHAANINGFARAVNTDWKPAREIARRTLARSQCCALIRHASTRSLITQGLKFFR